MSQGKKKISASKLVSAQSLASSFQSSALDTSAIDRPCLEIAATTSDAAGTFTIQGSVSGLNWSDLSMGAMALSGSSKTFLVDMQMTAVPLIRVAYTATSGSGTVTVYVSGKES